MYCTIFRRSDSTPFPWDQSLMRNLFFLLTIGTSCDDWCWY